MSRLYIVLVGLLLGWSGIALAGNELAVIYNGEPDLPAKVTLGSWGYMPQDVQVTVDSTGQEVAVDNTNYLYPGMQVRVDGTTVCRVESVLSPTSVRLSTAVNVVAGSTITLENPFHPVRLVPNRKIFGLSMLTLGRYQGVYFDLAEPLDSTSLFSEKNMYLEIYLRAAAEDVPTAGIADLPAATPTTPGPPTGTPATPALPGTTPPVAGTGPTIPMTLPAELLSQVIPPASTVKLPTLKNLRFTFFTEKGQGLLTITPDKFYPKDDVNKYWVRVGVPLSMLNPMLPVGGKLTRLLITSDEPCHFLLGRMAFVQDDDPFKVDMFVYPQFIEAKKRIFFAVRLKDPIGLSRYETTWCFNSKVNNTVDAMGDRVTYTFDTEGMYRVSCTVRDMSGNKPPVTRSVDLKVSRSLSD